MKLFFIIVSMVVVSGSAFGQKPSRAERVQQVVASSPKANWYDVMDYGPFLSGTFRFFDREGEVAVLKGIAIRIGEKEDHTIVFDSETMRMVAGFKGPLVLRGTPWDGKHGYNSHLPKNRSDYFFTTKWGPGWAIDGDWSDPREKDNGRHNGPLPRSHGQFVGIYRHEGGSLLKYTIGGVEILERPSYQNGTIYRSFHLSETDAPLQLLLSDPVKGGGENFSFTLIEAPEGVAIESLESGRLVVNIPAGAARQFHVSCQKGAAAKPGEFDPVDLLSLASGGPSLFPEEIEVEARSTESSGAFSTDTIPLPTNNPWKSKVRFGAFDFFPDGRRIACSSWNGDVWIAEGLDDFKTITWRRFATGLFQSLGLKIVDDVIYTMGRDQITCLHDLNSDGEADFYECFNNDVNITAGFHEFAFDLQTDEEGNFYFSKGQPVESGGRGFSPWTEHGGTVLKVSKDGKKLERLAWGLRAPGGVGLGPNGELTTGENEGSFLPRCKITWSKRPDLGRGDEMSFHGVVPSEWQDKKFVRTLPGAPTDYERPLCWLPYYVDNSSGSQFWVPESSSWNNHSGGMLHLSYGKSSVYRALIDEIDGQVQGGVYRLPIELTTAAMRGRFHPQTGHLYLVGFRGWQTNGGSGIQRVRLTGKEMPVPVALRAHSNGLRVEFSEALDPRIANNPSRYSVSKWDYVWGPQYGSGRFSINQYDAAARDKALVEPSKGVHNQIDSVRIRAVSLLNDGKSVFLYIEDMTPAMQMEIKMDLAAKEGGEFQQTIWNTIHKLHPDFEGHDLDLSRLPVVDPAPVGRPGLILSMAADSTDDALIVDRLAITLEDGQAATPFIDARRCQDMVFEGKVVIEARDMITFHLEGEGWASLRIDGQTVAEGELPLVSKPIELEAGPQSIFCHFSRTITDVKGRKSGGAGRLRLLWSGKRFIKEPVPPKVFRHLPNALVDAKNNVRHGRNLFAAVGCVRCHKASRKRINPELAMPELLETLPSFENIGNRMHQGWLEQWIRKPEGHCPSVAPDDAADIAVALATRRQRALKKQAGDKKAGEILAETLHMGPWIEGLMAEAKHTPGGLVDFLLDPSQQHPDTTFPDFHLSQKEGGDLAAWIRSNQPEMPRPSEGDAVRGEDMLTNRCKVCHGGDANAKYEFTASPLDTMWKEEWLVTGCLSEEEGDAPELGLSIEDKQALLAFRNVDSRQGLDSLNRFVPHEFADRAMVRLRCTACHSGEKNLPNLSLAGDKLRDPWVEQLLKGEVLRTRPYQKVRMPAFPSWATCLAKGIAHGAGVTTGVQITEPDGSLVSLGEEIVGASGYACSACHAMGGQPALQAFEGQGPNLQVAGERLREDFYQAWMHWPQRFDSTTIMPKYTADKVKALDARFFDGAARPQFEAVWEWMKMLEGAEKAPATGER